MTPLKSIRIRCLDCKSDNKNDIKNCDDPKCYLYPFRMNKKDNNKLTTLQSIKKYCLEFCCNKQIKEVELCPNNSCSLYLFRTGKNPNRKGIGNHSADVQKNIHDYAQKRL